MLHSLGDIHDFNRDKAAFVYTSHLNGKNILVALVDFFIHLQLFSKSFELMHSENALLAIL